MRDAMTRRAFLAGTGAVALAACSSGKTNGAASSSSSSAQPALTMISFSDSSALLPGSPQRVTMGFADRDGVVLDQSPSGAPLEFTVTANGQPVGPAATVPPHADGIPKTYFPLVFTPPRPGVYTVTTSVNGTRLDSSIQIGASTSVLGVGKPMVPFDTPTTTDQRGVQLLCTRQPQCPLHDVTLREALAGGTPVAFLVATPQFCQQAICGPVLDVLLGQKDAFPGVKMLHSEVYPTVQAAQPNTLQVTDVVTAYGLTFEPALYLASPDGTIVNRLDTIFDSTELQTALTDLTG